MYQNCAVVRVKSNAKSAWTAPAMLVANVFGDSDCRTVEGEDPVFPNTEGSFSECVCASSSALTIQVRRRPVLVEPQDRAQALLGRSVHLRHRVRRRQDGHQIVVQRRLQQRLGVR